MITFGFCFCDSFIVESFSNVQLRNDRGQALYAKRKYPRKARERAPKGGCENLTTQYLVVLCQSQSRAVKPVKPWQNASRSRRVAKCCDRTPRDGTCCREKVQSGSAI